MCMRDFMTEDIGFMDMDTFKKIFESGVPYAIKLNWRGEPLLHPKIVEMVKQAKDYGVEEVMMNTNGLLLTKEMTQQLSDAGLDWLIISVDGATKNTYEEIRQGGDFQLLYKNILYANHNFNGKIRIQICKQPKNEDEIELWKATFANLADDLRVGHLHDPQGKRGYKIDQPESCPSFWQRITVDWKGNIYPCPSDYQGHWSLGNVLNTTIRTAWHSGLLNYFRQTLADHGRKAVPPCKDCSSYC